jgi:hypothetical protein
MSWARIGEILDRQAAGASDETKSLASNVLPSLAAATTTSLTGSTEAGTAAHAAVSAATTSETGKERAVKLLDCLTFGLGSTLSDKFFGK